MTLDKPNILCSNGLDMIDLTERQLKALGTIWGHIRSHGKFPTYSELMRALELKSKQTVADFLDILERKGYIVRQERIGLTNKAIQYLIDREVRSLGLQFVSSFDFPPAMPERESSTTNIPSTSDYEGVFVVPVKRLEDTDFTIGAETELGVGLSNLVDYLTTGQSVNGTVTNNIYILHQSAAESIVNEGDHTKTNSPSCKISIMGGLRRIRISIDKLLGFFGLNIG